MECNINNSGSRDKEVTIDIENGEGQHESRQGLVPNFEKDNKMAGAPKPPRPPRGPSLDSSDMRLLKEISKIAVKKRERVERIKALKKMKALSLSSSSSSSSSLSSSISAMVITVLFFLVLIIQGVGCSTSSNVRLHVAPQPAQESRGLTAVQFYRAVQ
ncbi:T6A9.7 protein [Striga asiatica]|uniref:T6A9.7 protein n=1 Tax=Striga asiatica TaxID=4170 RepID=A0A5A7QGQ7_STRAF|nr:T6A9.7 protein [Striga asiatica]